MEDKTIKSGDIREVKFADGHTETHQYLAIDETEAVNEKDTVQIANKEGVEKFKVNRIK